MADNNWLLAAIYCTHLVLSITLNSSSCSPTRNNLTFSGHIQSPTPHPTLFTTRDQSHRASLRDASSSLGIQISTLARQLRSCNAATRRSERAARTHLKGTDGRSAAAKLYPFPFISILDKYVL